MTRDEMLDAQEWLSEHFTFILPDDTRIETILDLARIEVYRRGVQGVVIDPWNELEHFRPPQVSETEYVSDVLSKIRQFARNHNVHVWVVAHPKKLDATRDGLEPVPGLGSISGSNNFRNKADVGITIWRDLTDTASNVVELHVTKMRFDDSGRIGKVTFGYDTASKRLYELSDREV